MKFKDCICLTTPLLSVRLASSSTDSSHKIFVKENKKGAKTQLESSSADKRISFEYFVVADAGSHGAKVYV